MSVYYNEWEPYPAQWLRNLIKAGHLPEGDVDERDIKTVQAEDLRGFTQCHFFAGIGGWPLALKLASWGEGPVWMGSCPCQPFSSAGSREGHADERNLWPTWRGLIAKSKPATVFGEQVASAVAYGWLDKALLDLEEDGYTCAAAVLPACAVGKPHRRERIWYVGDAEGAGKTSLRTICERKEHNGERSSESHAERFMADTGLFGQAQHEKQTDRYEQHSESIHWLECHDGKSRPFEPSISLLANGISSRVERLSAYGNAIVPQVAAEFIEAFMECRP